MSIDELAAAARANTHANTHANTDTNTDTNTHAHANTDTSTSDARVDCAPKIRVANVKLIFAIFLMFIFVSSSAFADGVLSVFGESAIRGRTLTAWGVVIQGIVLVIGYIVAIYLTENQII